LSGIGLDSLFAMATFVIPFKRNGKTRLGDPALAWAMYQDVEAACAPLGDVLLCDAPGGQGEAVAAALAAIQGPVAVVNADVPCVTSAELEHLLDAAPALVAAADGTTNAIALADASDFRPLYGPGSAARFGLRALDLPGLRDDVDTWEDVRRLTERLGTNTRRALEVRV
jgi:2-phospho-L-lactate guanylyltransferase (CobY/MobA/RfbA family)